MELDLNKYAELPLDELNVYRNHWCGKKVIFTLRIAAIIAHCKLLFREKYLNYAP